MTTKELLLKAAATIIELEGPAHISPRHRLEVRQLVDALRNAAIVESKLKKK